MHSSHCHLPHHREQMRTVLRVSWGTKTIPRQMMRLGLQIKAGDDAPRSPRNTESVAQKRKVDGSGSKSANEGSVVWGNIK